MLFRFALPLLLFCCVCQASTGEQALTIYTEEFPPYNFIKDGAITGINIVIVTKACKIAGISCKFELYPWNRSMMLVSKNTRSGLMSTAKTPDRLTLFKWVGPLMSGDSCIYRLTERSDIHINELEDAYEYTLGASHDAAYFNMLSMMNFTEPENLQLFTGKYGPMRPLKARRIDLILGSANSITSQMAYIGLLPENAYPVATVPNPSGYSNYLALNPNVSYLVVNRLQSAIDEVKAEYSTIRNDFIKLNIAKVPPSANKELWQICMPN